MSYIKIPQGKKEVRLKDGSWVKIPEGVTEVDSSKLWAGGEETTTPTDVVETKINTTNPSIEKPVTQMPETNTPVINEEPKKESSFGSDLGNALVYTGTKIDSAILGGLANLTELAGFDSSYLREGQKYLQKAHNISNEKLNESLGKDSLLKTLATEGVNPINYTPIGKGLSGLAKLGGIIGFDTAGEIAAKGDMSGITPTDVAKVGTNVGIGLAGGKLLEKGIGKITGTATGTKYIDMDLGTLTQKASNNNPKALEELARRVDADPTLIEAAERNGFDLPADIYARGVQGKQIKEVSGMARSQVGGMENAEFRASIDDISKKADNMLVELGGRDISTVSTNTLSELKETTNSLNTAASKIYGNIKKIMLENPKEIMETPNISKVKQEILTELGGDTKSLDKYEKKLFSLIGTANYGRLDRERKIIGEALGAMPKGEYASANKSTLKKLYGAIKEDQKHNINRLQPDLVTSLEKADDLTKQRIAINEKIVAGFGKDGEGSIANKLRTMVTTGSKGDVTNLNKTLSIIPGGKPAKSEAILSAIYDVSLKGDNFNFNQFNKFYGGMRNKTEVSKILTNNLGKETVSKLDDLHRISKAISESQNNIIYTGKANQAILDDIKNGGLIKRLISGVGKLGGEYGEKLTSFITNTPKERIEKVTELFRSSEFKQMVKEVARDGKISERTRKVIERQNYTKKIADYYNMTPKALVTNIILQETEPTSIFTEE